MIVNWNGGSDLLECLRSLRVHPPAENWEAIVVDNASSDGSVDSVSHEFPWVRLIANKRNRGLAAANNQGIAASQAPFVLISNPDVLYGPGAIDALLDLLRRHDRAGFAIANLSYPDGGLQTSVGSLPSLTEALIGWRLSRHLPGGAAARTWWHHWAHDEERPVGHGAEACYLVRRDAVADIGLQDERFVLDWEGIDWSARAWEGGWEVWFCPIARVTHVGGVTLRQATGRWIASSHWGMYLYFRQRVRPVARPLLALLIAARAMIKFGLAQSGTEVYALIRRHPQGD